MTIRTMLVGVAPVLALTAVLGAQAQRRPNNVVRESWGGWSENGSWARLRVDYQGQFELTDDGRDVKTVSPGGSIELSSRGWLSLFGRRYIVRGNADGSISRRYLVGASDRPVTDAARLWIGNTLQALSQMGFGADVRLAQILAKDGPAATLDAIAQLRGDAMQARGYKRIFAGQPVDRAVVQRALRQTARDIGSDFEKAEVLMAIAAVQPLDPALSQTFGQSTDTIGSDYEHARVLLAALDTQARSATLVDTVVASAVRIGSDFEKARVLLRTIDTQTIDATTRPKLIAAAGTIGSEYERGRVLAALAVR